jgi:hypothetical protein
MDVKGNFDESMHPSNVTNSLIGKTSISAMVNNFNVVAVNACTNDTC